MIAIVNVDENVRPRGIHTYEIRINYKTITRFTHKREESLSKCLSRAANAVELLESKSQFNEIMGIVVIETQKWR